MNENSFQDKKAWVDVCGNEEHDFPENGFSSVTEFTAAKISLCLALQNGWHVRHLNFENAFPNGKFEREV